MKFGKRREPAPDVEDEPVPRGPVPLQRMSLTIEHHSPAGLEVAAVCTAYRETPAVVVVKAGNAPVELDWRLTPAQARELAVRLLEAATNCKMMDDLPRLQHWC
jgi:hypothetical protein